MSKTLALVSPPYSLFREMPIGLMYLQAWVKKHCCDWTVRIVDPTWEDPMKAILDCNPDIVGLTAMTGNYESVCRFGKQLKHAIDAPILIGGIHISTLPESFRKESFSDMVLGEGERRLTDRLNGVNQMRNMNTTCAPIDLSDYPDLDYRGLSPQYYKPRMSRVWRKPVVAGVLLSSRGCPYKCPFCSTTTFWGRYRVHTVDWVLRQMEQLVDLGCDTVHVWDDMFVVKRSRLKEIATGFQARGLHKHVKHIALQSRVDSIDDEVFESFRMLNVGLIGFGWESGSDKTLKYLKHNTVTVADNRKAINTCVRNGLKPSGSVMFGSPGETLIDMMKTLWFMIWGTWNGVLDWFVVESVPYTDTHFWEVALARGKVHPQMNFDRLKFHTKLFGDAMLVEIPLWQYRAVYLLAQLVSMPSKLIKTWTCVTGYLRHRMQTKEK